MIVYFFYFISGIIIPVTIFIVHYKNHKKIKTVLCQNDKIPVYSDERREEMGYSVIAHALINYVESHINDFSMAKMSESFGFSEIYLRELFFKNMDMPVMKYYKMRRLMAAGFEILYSDKTILQIALESGFSSHEAFTRAFYKIFGMTPGRFRTVRPLAGCMQLDTGIFGLDFVTEKNRRSGNAKMDKQNGSSEMLYGIRKIAHGSYGSSTMFPICIKAVSEYLGDDVSYARIMAASGAAFRLVWNREEWDLSNIDIYHALYESNSIYQYGARAIGRAFSFLGREENTTKKDFTDFIKSHLAKGYPVIALGIIGPPEPCIIAGYKPDNDAVMGWNFFQDDLEYASDVDIMDNGYFCCNNWWENTDTQAVMCIGAKNGIISSDKEILENAIEIMKEREEYTYAKGIRAYDAWREMLSDEKWFVSGSFDYLFSKLLVQNDATVCISDGRHWAAKYFKELSVKYGEKEQKICQNIAEKFDKTSSIAKEMMELIGGWDNTELMLKKLGNHNIRKQLCRLVNLAKEEDIKAYRQMQTLYQQI